MAAMDRRTRHYLGAALWSSSDDDGTPLDKTYTVSDFAPEAIRKAKRDVDAFWKKAGDLIDASGLSDESVAHDFWLTRNGHGAGFWDRDLGEVGDQLTKVAKSFGELDVYRGDDGQLWF